MLIGHAHVSTDDQSLTLQLDSLRDFGCERIFEEKLSDSIRHPILDKALEFARVGIPW